MPTDKYALSKRRYIASSSDDEPPNYKSHLSKKQERPAPKSLSARPRPTRVDIDLSSDDEDLFKPRPKDKRQISSGKGASRAYDIPRTGKEKSSSDSDFDFNFDYRAAARDQRKERGKEPISKYKSARKSQQTDTCSSCTDSECDEPRKCPKPTGRKLLERSHEHSREAPKSDHKKQASGPKGFVSDRLSRNSKVEGKRDAPVTRRALDVAKTSGGNDVDSLDSSDDIFLGAARSCKLLERHIQRHESQKREFRTISSNDEFLRRTFQESMSPRSEQLRRGRTSWPPDGHEQGIPVQTVASGTKVIMNTEKSLSRKGLPDAHANISSNESAIAYRSREHSRPQLEKSSSSKRKAIKPKHSSQGCYPIQEGPEDEGHIDHEGRVLVHNPGYAPQHYLHPRELVRPVADYSSMGGPKLIWDQGVLGPLPLSPNESKDKENAVIPVKRSASTHLELKNPAMDHGQFHDQATPHRRPEGSEIKPDRQEHSVLPAPLQRTRSERDQSTSMDSDRFAHVAGAAVRVMNSSSHPGEDLTLR